MKRGGGVHTVPLPKGLRWANEIDRRVLLRHPDKEAAVDAGREIARRPLVEHTIHRLDGEITEKNSYGSDPNPPNDKN